MYMYQPRKQPGGTEAVACSWTMKSRHPFVARVLLLGQKFLVADFCSPFCRMDMVQSWILEREMDWKRTYKLLYNE